VRKLTSGASACSIPGARDVRCPPLLLLHRPGRYLAHIGVEVVAIATTGSIIPLFILFLSPYD
jgi:hypothetical protein